MGLSMGFNLRGFYPFQWVLYMEMRGFSMDYEVFMREALAIATEDENEVPVGALIVKDGEIIARAHNQREGETQTPLGHAELIVLHEAAKKLGTRRLTGCTLFVTLEPCPMCAGAMVMAGLTACVFGAFDEKQGCCGSVYDLTQEKNFFHHVRCVGGVLETEAKKQLQDFFSKKR